MRYRCGETPLHFNVLTATSGRRVGAGGGGGGGGTSVCGVLFGLIVIVMVVVVAVVGKYKKGKEHGQWAFSPADAFLCPSTQPCTRDW